MLVKAGTIVFTPSGQKRKMVNDTEMRNVGGKVYEYTGTKNGVPVTVRRVVGVKEPTLRTLEKWRFDGIAKAIDGCKVEPDGTCEHGCDSWMLALGYI